MVAAKHRDVMRHAGVAQFNKPFAGVVITQDRLAIGTHQMALRLHGLAMAGGQVVYAVVPPQAEDCNRHVGRDRCFADRRLLIIEVACQPRSSVLSRRRRECLIFGDDCPKQSTLVRLAAEQTYFKSPAVDHA